MNYADYVAILFLILAGYFFACMDDWQFSANKVSRWPYTWLISLGIKENRRYLKFIVFDDWHTAKNFLLASISFVVFFARLGELSAGYYLLAGVVIGLSFIFFYHVVFGNKVYLRDSI